MKYKVIFYDDSFIYCDKVEMNDYFEFILDGIIVPFRHVVKVIEVNENETE